MTALTRRRTLLSEHGFDGMFFGYPDPTFAMDAAGKIFDCNEAMLFELRITRGQLIGSTLASLISVRHSRDVAVHFAAVVAGGNARFETEFERRDSTRMRAGVVLFPVVHEEKLVAVVGFFRDIADLDTSYDLAERGQAQLSMASRVSQSGSWSIDTANRRVSFSDELCGLLGLPLGHQPRFEHAFSWLPEPDQSALSSTIERCIGEGTAFDEDYSMFNAAQQLMNVRVLGEAIRNPSGDIVGVQGRLYDISDQVGAIADKLDIEERLASLANAMSDGIVILDDDWSFRYVNLIAEEILARPAAGLLGHTIWELFPEGEGATFAHAFRQAAADKATARVREFYEPLGRWLEVSAYPLTAGVAIYLRDVTDDEARLRTAMEAKEEIIAQAALLDVARDAIIVRGLDHTIRYWNRAATELYGWTTEEVVGLSMRDFVKANLASYDESTALTIRDGSWQGQVEQMTRDGLRIFVDCRLTLVSDADGNPDAIFAVNTDITERRDYEQRQLRQERMESLGTLAGGVAHDLNNVLTPILMSVQILAKDEHDAARKDLLAIMETSVKRGAEMIQQVLSFARGVEGRRIEVDLNKLLGELLAECTEALPAHISLDLRADPGLWRTNGDPTQLLQVFVNLIYNARDAMDTGSISISAANVNMPEPFPSITHVGAPGDYISIEIEDEGKGMTADVLDKIFEPFYTTKGVGLGTGLGLATSAAILTSHGGLVQVSSQPGTGTRFRIFLPASRGQTTPALMALDDQELEDLPRGFGELVLVVDDEAMIRTVTCRALEAYGYTTAIARNGAAALEYCDNNRDAVSVVFTDMMMPLMDGAELASVLRVRHPEIRVIAASGLTANNEIARAADSGVHQFLSKPFTTGQLLRVVRSVLDEETTDD